MKLKKVLFVVGILMLLVNTRSFSQYYNSAVGIRLGIAPGLTGKFLMNNNFYLEGLFTARWDGFNITALAEMTQPLPDTPGLGWYYGLGANFGVWDTPNDGSNDNDLNLGANGILGMEYTFEDVPINASIDWKPMFIIITHPDFYFDEFALSVRYTFNRR